MVVIRGLNDDEIVDFARKTLTDGWHVRFIELMPIGANVDWAGYGTVPIPEIRSRIDAQIVPLRPIHGPTGNGPARYHQFSGAQGSVGFIGAKSEHFCHECNRLRLTADGRLRPCLMSDKEIDLREALRGGDAGAVKSLLAEAIHRKPLSHHLDEALAPRDRTMAQIGG